MPHHRIVKIDELVSLFNLPEKQVARQLGVCLTSLKKICRQNGITRWPYRKLKSLDKKISKIETAMSNSSEDPTALMQKWEQLKAEKKALPFSASGASATHISSSSAHHHSTSSRSRNPRSSTLSSSSRHNQDSDVSDVETGNRRSSVANAGSICSSVSSPASSVYGDVPSGGTRLVIKTGPYNSHVRLVSGVTPSSSSSAAASTAATPLGYGDAPYFPHPAKQAAASGSKKRRSSTTTSSSRSPADSVSSAETVMQKRRRGRQSRRDDDSDSEYTNSSDEDDSDNETTSHHHHHHNNNNHKKQTVISHVNNNVAAVPPMMNNGNLMMPLPNMDLTQFNNMMNFAPGPGMLTHQQMMNFNMNMMAGLNSGLLLMPPLLPITQPHQYNTRHQVPSAEEMLNCSAPSTPACEPPRASVRHRPSELDLVPMGILGVDEELRSEHQRIRSSTNCEEEASLLQDYYCRPDSARFSARGVSGGMLDDCFRVPQISPPSETKDNVMIDEFFPMFAEPLTTTNRDFSAEDPDFFCLS